MRIVILASVIVTLSFLWFAGKKMPAAQPTPATAPDESADGIYTATSPRIAENPEFLKTFPTPVAQHIPAGEEAVTISAPIVRRKRAEQKPIPTISHEDPASYAAQDSEPQPRTPETERGLDPAMGAAIPELQVAGRRFAYGFVLSDEYLVDETLEELQALGAVVLGAHGELYKARFDLELDAPSEALRLPYVQWVGFNAPEQKIDPALQKQFQQENLEDGAAELSVIINLFDDDTDGRFGVALQAAGAAIGQYYPDFRAYAAAVAGGDIEKIASLDFVLFVEPEPVHKPYHDESVSTIGADYIRPGGTGERFGGATAVLGIMDSGFMLGTTAAVPHVDLLTKFGCGMNFTTDGIDVWNDVDDHGTHVLGTIAGTGAGDSRYRGTAPNAGDSTTNRIRAAKVFNSTTGVSEGSSVTDAMNWLDDASACGGPKPDVINFSGGVSGSNQRGTDITSRALDDKVFFEGQLYVVAAGNDGPGSGTISSPGTAKNALTVGNVLDFGYPTVGDVSESSSRGPTGDGRMKPNVVGPGTFITSLDAASTDQYVANAGTSMSTPHVSGLALTLIDHFPNTFRGRPYLLRAHMMASAILHDDTVSPTTNTFAGRNDYGMGRVSASLSHWVRNNPNGWQTSWSWGNVKSSNFVFRDITVPADADRLVVVMTWDEPQASAGAAQAVTHDLDLWVDRGIDCTNNLGQCGEYASQSRIDNVEYLIIENPPAGTYRLKATPWRAPSSGLPVGMAAVTIRGDPTPQITLSAVSSNPTPALGTIYNVTTTVSNPSYVASGVHLTAFPSFVDTSSGTFAIGQALFGPDPLPAFPPGNIVPTGGLGCSVGEIPPAPVSATPQIALIERGICFFSAKAFNAQQRGYDAYIVFNDAARGNDLLDMSASTGDPVTIPGIFVGHGDGLAMQATATQVRSLSGANLLSVTTTREDNVTMSFAGKTLTLGNIIESDSRSAIWTFEAATGGHKTIKFRAWSENGGTVTQSVVVDIDSPDLVVIYPSGDPEFIVEGNTVTLSATVENQGTVGSASTTLRWLRSADSRISVTDAEIGTDSVGTLSANGTSAESLVTFLPVGRWWIGACVDAVSGEPNTFNNCSAGAQITVSLPGADTDSDGVPDAVDNCPLIGNPGQKNADSDAAGDACDAFPNHPGETRDSDSDGMGDNFERRFGLNPNYPKDAAVDSDGDGASNLEEFQNGTNPLVNEGAVIQIINSILLDD